MFQQQIGQTQNCNQIGWQNQLQYVDRIVYIDKPCSADIAIDKVENGYIVTMHGKRFIAKNTGDIASVIAKNEE